MSRFLVAAAAAVAFAAAARPQPDDDPPGTDADILKAAGLDPDDGAALVGYLRVRTVSDADRAALDAVIRRFAADKFEDRLAAAAAAERLGPLAITPLRQTAADKTADPEIAYRAALILKKLQAVDHARVSAAAVRGVVRLRPPGAAAAVLGFLPAADTDAAADDIRTALKALAARDGAADPALVAGLADDSPSRRAAAYVALVEGGPAGKRIRLPDAYPKVVAAVRRDPDVTAKFLGLWSLVHTTREREFIPDLIALVPDLPRGRLWQLEDLLLRLAGEHPPGGRFGRTAENLAAARDAWAGWWAKAAPDLAAADLTPRVRGLTDVVQADPTGQGRGTVYTLGPDLKETWRLGGNLLNMQPSDARMLPNDRVLLVEHNYGRVTERDRAGSAVRTYNAPQPVAAEVLPNGNWLVVARSQVTEVGFADGIVRVVHSHVRRPVAVVAPGGGGFVNNAADIVTGARLPTGEVVFVTSAPQGPNLYRLDARLNPVGAPQTLGRFQNVVGGLDVTAAGKLLACHQDKVTEYDPKDGKAGWSYDVPFPSAVQRLLNGNTLITTVNAARAVEVTPDREVVWEYRPADNVPPSRVRRR